MSAPRLSIVIPTRDRLDALLDTLDTLDRQEVDPGDVEVVVVDNGCSDGTADAVRARRARLPLTLVQEPKPGPAAARNRGVEHARGAAILFTGDDTRPADAGVVAAHLRLHAADPRPVFGVLGRVTWRPDKPITPFMRWLERSRVQFAYDDLKPGRVDAANYFYTSHVSVKRALLESVGGFDERFPYAAFEDVELGLRLVEAGLELEYHPELLVHHDHPYRPSAFARRHVKVGQSARLMHDLHGDSDLFPEPRWTWPILSASVPVLAAFASRTERVWQPLAMAAWVRGWRRGAR